MEALNAGWLKGPPNDLSAFPIKKVSFMSSFRSFGGNRKCALSPPSVSDECAVCTVGGKGVWKYKRGGLSFINWLTVLAMPQPHQGHKLHQYLTQESL